MCLPIKSLVAGLTHSVVEVSARLSGLYVQIDALLNGLEKFARNHIGIEAQTDSTDRIQNDIIVPPKALDLPTSEMGTVCHIEVLGF